MISLRIRLALWLAPELRERPDVRRRYCPQRMNNLRRFDEAVRWFEGELGVKPTAKALRGLVHVDAGPKVVREASAVGRFYAQSQKPDWTPTAQAVLRTEAFFQKLAAEAAFRKSMKKEAA